MPEIMHGWFSQKQQNNSTNKIIYKSTNGNEVVVTNVSQTDENNSDWDDIVYLGTLAKYIRIEKKETTNTLTNLISSLNNQMWNDQPRIHPASDLNKTI